MDKKNIKEIDEKLTFLRNELINSSLKKKRYWENQINETLDERLKLMDLKNKNKNIN